MNQKNQEFSKSKIYEFRRNLYEIENKNNISTPEIKEIENNLLELEQNISKLKKYYDFDDIEYRVCIMNSAFNGNYI